MRKKRISPTKMIACGFLGVIAVGTALLMLPPAHSGEEGIPFVDALFTAVSAVCITGLGTLDPGTDFSVFGHAVILLLIQIGGLGITTFGAGLVALLGGRLNQRENNLVREALNYPTFKDVMPLIRAVLVMTLATELIGAGMAFVTFSRDYPVGQAVWYSVFHSISSFTNAGIEILEGNSLTRYEDDVWMNFTTAALTIVGGIGFFVIRDLGSYLRGNVRRYLLKKDEKPKERLTLTLHTKVVLSVTAGLLAGGAVLLKLTEGDTLSWMDAMFASMTARSTGFATVPLTEFSMAGLLVMCVLMFVGASPGSTGGGVKTTTMFVLIKSLISTATGREAVAFGKKIKDDAMHKSFVIISLGLAWLLLAAFLLAALEPQLSLAEVTVETVAAFATVGLSLDVTPTLGTLAKLVMIVTMYIGRLGPLTIATMWVDAKTGVSRPEEDIPIG